MVMIYCNNTHLCAFCTHSKRMWKRCIVSCVGALVTWTCSWRAAVRGQMGVVKCPRSVWCMMPCTPSSTTWLMQLSLIQRWDVTSPEHPPLMLLPLLLLFPIFSCLLISSTLRSEILPYTFILPSPLPSIAFHYKYYYLRCLSYVASSKFC